MQQQGADPVPPRVITSRSRNVLEVILKTVNNSAKKYVVFWSTEPLEQTTKAVKDRSREPSVSLSPREVL